MAVGIRNYTHLREWQSLARELVGILSSLPTALICRIACSIHFDYLIHFEYLFNFEYSIHLSIQLLIVPSLESFP